MHTNFGPRAWNVGFGLFFGWPKTLSGQDICEFFQAFFSFSKLFSCNSISIYGFHLGVGLLSSKINNFS